MSKIQSSEITPEHVYLSRRRFMVGVGTVALGSTVLAACGPQGIESLSGSSGENSDVAVETGPTELAAIGPALSSETDELGDKLNSFEQITNFNNFYEFTTIKERVATLATDFKTDPWTVEVGGLVNNPKTFGVEDLISTYDQEERIYRLRCVEGWSMVIPWVGFPLAKLLQEVEPMSRAKYVRFETLYDPEGMPGQRDAYFPWPYVEGLTVAEAMNDLAILSTGLYGKQLTPQNGAPIRLVVPWKYGFKSIKSIVKIDLVEEMPVSLWMQSAPNEYGFYANVNPEVDHPRWSQSTERRIGEFGRRKTLMFNGYEAEVASLYRNVDLRVNY